MSWRRCLCGEDVSFHSNTVCLYILVFINAYTAASGFCLFAVEMLALTHALVHEAVCDSREK